MLFKMKHLYSCLHEWKKWLFLQNSQKVIIFIVKLLSKKRTCMRLKFRKTIQTPFFVRYFSGKKKLLSLEDHWACESNASKNPKKEKSSSVTTQPNQKKHTWKWPKFVKSIFILTISVRKNNISRRIFTIRPQIRLRSVNGFTLRVKFSTPVWICLN